MPSNWRDFAPACRVHRRAPASRDPRSEPGTRRFGAASLSTTVDSAPFTPSKIVDSASGTDCASLSSTSGLFSINVTQALRDRIYRMITIRMVDDMGHSAPWGGVRSERRAEGHLLRRGNPQAVSGGSEGHPGSYGGFYRLILVPANRSGDSRRRGNEDSAAGSVSWRLAMGRRRPGVGGIGCGGALLLGWTRGSGGVGGRTDGTCWAAAS